MNPVTRVLQVSDMHLSRTHPLFQFNFEVTLREIERIKPDVVIYTGDLSLNGPDNPDDVRFACEQIRRTGCTHFALPGNHDIGLAPGGGHAEQLITEARLGHYRDIFAYDRFTAEIDGWRIVGLNSQLMGSDLAAEAEQFAWLANVLACDLPVALFMHFPLFIHGPGDTDAGHHALAIDVRRRLMAMFTEANNVRFIGTGHLHQAKSAIHAGTRHEWAPSSAFVIPGQTLDSFGGRQVTGMLLHEFGPGTVVTRTIEPELIMNVDLRNWSRASPHGYYQIVRQPWLLDQEQQLQAA